MNRGDKFLDEKKAEKLKCPHLHPLRWTATKEEAVAWLESVRQAADCLERLLSFTPSKFWSTLVYSKVPLRVFDELLESLPRAYEAEERKLVGEVWTLLASLVLSFFLRISIWNPQLNKGLSEEEWKDVQREQQLISPQRLVSAASLFVSRLDPEFSCFALFSKIVTYFWKIDSKFTKNLSAFIARQEETVENLEQWLLRLETSLDRAFQSWKVESAQMLEEHLRMTVDFSWKMTRLVKLCEVLKDRLDCGAVLSRLPSLVESLCGSWSVGRVVDVAALLPDYPLRRLFRLRTQALDFTVSLAALLLQHSSPDDRLALLHINLHNLAFLYRLNEKTSVSELLCDCDEKEREYVEFALEDAVIKFTRQLTNELDEQGLLDGLGDVSEADAAVAECVATLCAIFPDLSPEFVHLSSRHFAYCVEEAIVALSSQDILLPANLRRLRDLPLPPSSVERPFLPTVSFDYEMDFTETLASSSHGPPVNNDLKGLFSLAPISKPKDKENRVEETKPEESHIMKALREALERLKARAANEDWQLDEARLVPLAHSKKHAGVEKFTVTEAEKVAVRPFYEKFRFETDEDNVYDDEFDDAYEEKEYNMDPVKTDDVAPSSEDEGKKNKTPPMQRKQYRDEKKTEKEPKKDEQDSIPASQNPRSSHTSYTGGRQRQQKERYKNDFKQRGADRKARGGGLF